MVLPFYRICLYWDICHISVSFPSLSISWGLFNIGKWQYWLELPSSEIQMAGAFSLQLYYVLKSQPPLRNNHHKIGIWALLNTISCTWMESWNCFWKSLIFFRRQNKQTKKKCKKKGLMYDQFTSQPTAVTNDNLMFGQLLAKDCKIHCGKREGMGLKRFSREKSEE